MSDESAGTGRRPYNRPRRYPVPPRAEPEPTPGAPAEADVTRQNPTLAEAAQDYGRRFGEAAAPVTDAPPGSLPSDAPSGSTPYPYPGAEQVGPPPTAPPQSRMSRRALVIGAAVVVVIAVVGLVVGLSGGDDPRPGAGPTRPPTRSASTSAPAPTPPSTPPSTSSVGGAPSATVVPSSSAVAPSNPTAAGEVCARLGVTAPLTAFVTPPHPIERMPDTYVEPGLGTRLGICAGVFRPGGGGAGRGRVAYLAYYDRQPASQYALMLKTLGWQLVADLPRPTYRNNLTTTVTLVQQGTALVTVVGTGR